ncbi:hypothetical protein SeLEV6574_g06067 [Synchytrium endobioticum]|uniref:Autophagy-related protein 18 n=1 Tax=Synchytrium endobioticum TaxID=286115 RepID=A0A507CQQ4_9FUNG|nr:hypothetical protein SeLEV6574_g06067 [Synchytrium endobioticum]
MAASSASATPLNTRNNTAISLATSIEELPVLIPELLGHLSPRDDVRIVQSILDSESRTNDLWSKRHDHTRLISATLSRRLETAKAQLADAETKASSLHYPTDLRSIESLQDTIRKELQGKNDSITSLEQTYGQLMAELEALEVEEKKDSETGPDPSMMMLHIFQGLGIQMKVENGVYTAAFARSHRQNDFMLINFDDKYSAKYYADILWDAYPFCNIPPQGTRGSTYIQEDHQVAMNIGGKSNNDILFINFNQDFSCISVGSRKGYKIYNCDPFGKCYEKTDGGMGIVEMLFCTSLVALVGAGEQPAFSPRRLQIINTKRQSTICELTPFVTAILAVKLNRKRLIVTLEEHIYIYDISNMKLLHTIDTSPNPNALCALSPSSDNCYLAYPLNTSGAAGELLIYDAINLQAVNIIQAHKSPLSCIAFNYDGTTVATASDKGTIIRVFSIPTGQKLYQFRRGTYPARIYSISFNLNSTMLCVSSNTDTVHIYKLYNHSNGNGMTSSSNDHHNEKLSFSGGGMTASGGSFDESLPGTSNGERRWSEKKFSLKTPLTSAVGAVSQYFLPDSVTEMWDPQRDFAFCKLPSGSRGIPNMCALSNTAPQAMVVTAEGYFYEYNVDLELGGECILLKQYSLMDLNEDMAGSSTR